MLRDIQIIKRKERAKVLTSMKNSGMSLKEISTIVGISRQRVHQLISGYHELSQSLRQSNGWYRKLCDEVLKRDYHKCSKCGDSKSKLIIHHKDSDNYNNDINNLQTLCNRCHSSLHFTGIRYVKPKYYICNRCGKCFEYRPGYENCSGSRVFCSPECSHDYYNITLFCEVCNKQFTRLAINIIRNVKQGRSNGEHIFCSKKCHGVWFGDRHGRKKKFNWDDAYDLYKKGLSYREIADMFNVSRAAISHAVKK